MDTTKDQLISFAWDPPTIAKEIINKEKDNELLYSGYLLIIHKLCILKL